MGLMRWETVHMKYEYENNNNNNNKEDRTMKKRIKSLRATN
jgi:hypothetical protein